MDDQILEILKEMKVEQREFREGISSNLKTLDDEISSKLKTLDDEISSRLKTLEDGQDKQFDLLVQVSKQTLEPLDHIEALSKRVWNTEKDISKLQRRTGSK